MTIILHVPLVDKSLLMNMYKFHNLPVLHHVLQNTFHYSVEGKYLALLSDDDYATLPSFQDILAFVCSKTHVSI